MTEITDPVKPALESLAKMMETVESFLKESSLRMKDIEQGARIAEELFGGAAKNIEQRQDQIITQQ